MRFPIVFLSILSVAAFLLSFMYNLSTESVLRVFSLQTSLFIFVLAILGMSFMFFGYGTPVAAFFAGLFCAVKFQSDAILGFASIILTIVISYCTIKLGDALAQDIHGKGNLRHEWKALSFLIAAAVVFSLVFGF